MLTLEDLLKRRSEAEDNRQLPSLGRGLSENEALKQENSILRVEIAKLENKLNHMERQFRQCITETTKISGQVSELKALKKTFTQYFTSENLGGEKSWCTMQEEVSPNLTEMSAINNS